MLAGDWAGAADHFAPDGVFYGTIGGIDQEEILEGPAAFVRYMDDVAKTWDEWDSQLVDIRGGGDTFVVFWHETARSRGIEMENETATVLKLRNGKVIEGRSYLDRAAALEAAGLS